MERARSFYSRTGPGHFLVNARVPADHPSVPPLNGFELDRQLAEWLDCKLAAAMPALRVKDGLDDDSIPCVYPHFGIAEHSAWLGLDVNLQETTSLPIPGIADLDDLSAITLNERNKWFGYMKSAYDYLRTKKDGTFVLAVRGTMGPMDMANAVRGDELYTDFLLNPEPCHRLLDFMVKAIRWYFPRLCSWADEIEGGHVFAFGESWMPAGTIGHLSNDAAMLCSSKIYEEFGFSYEQRLVSGYGHVLYHVHNEKLHYVPRLAGLSGLAMLQISADPKTAPPICDLARILAATGSANLMLDASSDEVREHIDELRGRNAFLQVNCRDRADAEDIVRFVRAKSKPL